MAEGDPGHDKPSPPTGRVERGPLERVLSIFADVRKGEGPTVLLLTLGLFLLLSAYYVIKPVRDSLITGVPGGTEYKSYMGAAIAVALSVAVWAFKKSFLKLMLGSQLELPDRVWQRLNVAWILYCVFMAVVNGYVALYFSTEAWVDFKLWGYVFPIAFLVGQGFYIAPHLKGDDERAKP